MAAAFLARSQLLRSRLPGAEALLHRGVGYLESGVRAESKLWCSDLMRHSFGRTRLFSSAANKLGKLTSLQLKELLDAEGIDYRDCSKRTDLLKRANEKLPSGLIKDGKKESIQPNSDVRQPSSRGLLQDEENTIALFQKCSPSVVNIRTTNYVISNYFEAIITEIPAGQGSGIIWDKDGHVVTNLHVVAGKTHTVVGLSSGAVHDAKIVASEPSKDIAVLKLIEPKEELTPIQIGHSHSLQVGQKVFAIGNPFGLDQSLSAGIISALNRDIKSITGKMIKHVIQSDAAINPGNSGGALLDSRGRLIGLNTAIFSTSDPLILAISGVFGGIGFAIPVDTVRRIVSQIISTGRVSRAGLGVTCLSDEMARGLGVETGVVVAQDKTNKIEGLTLDTKLRRIIPGEIIIGVDNLPVHRLEDLSSLVDEKQPGDRVKLDISRGGNRVQRSIDWKLVDLNRNEESTN